MLRKLITVSAASGLLMSTALAQAPAPSGDAGKKMSPPASSTEAPAVKSDAMKSNDTKATTTTAASPTGKPEVISGQQPDQMLASKFKGTDVVGSDNKKIGDVEDILFDKTGSILAVVVGVGGFLGIGAKSVALTMPSFEIIPEEKGNGNKLKLAMSKEQLQKAAEFKPYEPPRPQPTPVGSQPLRPKPATN